MDKISKVYLIFQIMVKKIGTLYEIINRVHTFCSVKGEMNMRKKNTALALSLSALMLVSSGCSMPWSDKNDGDEENRKEGRVVNIYSWNSENKEVAYLLSKEAVHFLKSQQ